MPETMQRMQTLSPHAKARLAGGFYLLIFVIGMFSEFYCRGRLVIDNDAAATARNLAAHPAMYRLGGAAELLVLTCDTCVALLFYELFKPVSRSLSLFAAVFRLILVAVMAVNLVNYLAPLDLLATGPLQPRLKLDQVEALAMVSLKSYGTGYEIALVFFGFHCLLIGYLILRSTFLPRFLGVLMAVAGFGWLTFLWEPFANHLYPYVLLPGIVGEGLLTLWLLAIGVNNEQWARQAGTADEARP
jgi:hypothetical protein